MTMLVRHARVPALAIAAAITLAACGSVRYPQQYVLHFAPAAPAQARPANPLGLLVVRELGCPSYLCEGRLVYREGTHRIGFYDYHRWAVDPGAALTRLVAERIRGVSLFDGVTIAGSAARAAYQLRGDIERFEEVDHETGVQAVCTISAEIVEVKTGTVVWNGTFTESVPVGQRDVAGVVVGLSTASETVADRLVASIVKDVPSRRSP